MRPPAPPAAAVADSADAPAAAWPAAPRIDLDTGPLPLPFAGPPTPVRRGDAALRARALLHAGCAQALAGEAIVYHRAAFAPAVRVFVDAMMAASRPIGAAPLPPDAVRPWDFAPGWLDGVHPEAAPGLGVAWGSVSPARYDAERGAASQRFWQPEPFGADADESGAAETGSETGSETAGRFVAADAVPLLVWPVWSAAQTVLDIVAIPASPLRGAAETAWWRRTGLVDVLGADALALGGLLAGDAAPGFSEPANGRRPVRLFATPKAWLAAAGDGCGALGVAPAGLCVLDPDGAEARFLYRAIGDGLIAVACDDAAHAAAVDALARPGRRPYRDGSIFVAADAGAQP
jgi:hypothetical protein